MKKQVIFAMSLLLGGFTQLEASNFVGYVNKEGVTDTLKVKKNAFVKKDGTPANYYASYFDDTQNIGMVDFYTLEKPDTLVKIGAKAFENCTTASAICIPGTVTELDCSAFDGCDLDSLFSMNMTPPTLTNGSLPSELQKIKVPGNYVETYKAAAGWSTYADKIVAIPNVKETDDYVVLSYSDVYSYEKVGLFGGKTTITVHVKAHCFCKLTPKDLYLWDDKKDVKDTLESELQLFDEYKQLKKDIHLVRTFKKNGTRHTLCLPFGVTKEQFVASSLGEGNDVTIQTFTGATVTNPGKSNEALEITVTDVDVSTLGDNDTLLRAGKPYILTWEDKGETILFPPVFRDVRLNLSEPTTPAEWTNNVKMQGVFWRTELEKENYSTLFISPDGTFSWPSKTNDMRGFRAYFLVNTSSSSPIRKGMPVRLNEVSGKSMPTAIENAECTMQNAQCTKYMRNGQLIIRRDNVEYSIMGGQIR